MFRFGLAQVVVVSLFVDFAKALSNPIRGLHRILSQTSPRTSGALKDPMKPPVSTDETIAAATENAGEAIAPGPDYELQVFFDGDCPLCRREIEWLRRRDRTSRIDFIDIAAPDFSEAEHGKGYDELMQSMHARFPDGRWIDGVESFRHMYRLVNLGFLVAWTRVPGLRQLADWGYTVFARYRLRLSKRCSTGSCDVSEKRS